MGNVRLSDAEVVYALVAGRSINAPDVWPDVTSGTVVIYERNGEILTGTVRLRTSFYFEIEWSDRLVTLGDMRAPNKSCPIFVVDRPTSDA